MSTPYEALLSLRQIEEQQAEIVVAAALRQLHDADKALGRARATRTAWLAEPTDGSMSELMADLEVAEREAVRRRERAERVAAQARETLLERRRDREIVEKLHRDAPAAAALETAQLAQRDLDELTTRTGGAFARAPR